MGRSSNACFRIISCGADSGGVDDNDGLSPSSENKQSSDKRRWSFRKRSSTHQVPSNTVISEPQFVATDKKKPDATTVKSISVNDSSVPEKNPVIEQPSVIASLSPIVFTSEKTALLEQTSESLSTALVNSESPLATGQANETTSSSSAIANSEVAVRRDIITTAIDVNLQEKVAVVIQAAARRFLAQREMQKLKKVVKLQAVVRGHIVRRQAIGTLRCVQAIVKMQALVRARRVQCQLAEKLTGQEKSDSRNSDLKSNQTNSTIEKLLSNGFARQLLESTSRTKAIHISCDSLRHDSAWQWLERWMAITSSKVNQPQELDWAQGYQGEKEKSDSYEELDVTPVVEASEISSNIGPNLSPKKTADTENKEDSETDNSGKFEFQAPPIVSDQCLKSSAEGEKEQSQGEVDIDMKKVNFTQIKETSTDDNYHNNTESPTENLEHTTNISVSDSVETEAKKVDLGLRKIRNPAFAAVQAKFEELSSAPRVNRSFSIEPKPSYSQVVSMTKNKDVSSTGRLATQNPVIQIAGSECGTEISISSTLDSPDGSETDGGEIVLELGSSGQTNHNVNNGASLRFENMKADTGTLSDASNKFGGLSTEEDENMANSVAAVDSVIGEQQPVEITFPENSKAEVYRSSPERSPRNHVIAPESHGTPSSEVSMQSKASKNENHVPARKSKSKSGSKSSPSNVKNDSNEKRSIERDAKNANIRSSSVMAKLDNEPRRSISSNLLPSYMQATKSAKAKAQGSISLKSSPDAHDKDNNIKKRHSFPIADEKQGSSPRVQRSTSQMQHSSKHSNNHSPNNPAERRWQR